MLVEVSRILEDMSREQVDRVMTETKDQGQLHVWSTGNLLYSIQM